MDLHLVYITARDQKEAKKLAKTLVEEDLAACVNILGASESFYKWKGKLETEKEVVLIAKVKGSRLQEFIERARALHSYECPCIVTLPIEGGHKEYLDWLAG